MQEGAVKGPGLATDILAEKLDSNKSVNIKISSLANGSKLYLNVRVGVLSACSVCVFIGSL